MRPVLVPIVEGEGEVAALPRLLHRLLADLGRRDWLVAEPRNAGGLSNLTRTGGLEKFLRHAGKVPRCAAVLVLADADNTNDCPATMARTFAARVRQAGARHPTAVVFARREYEAWFLASLESLAGYPLNGQPGLPAGLTPPSDPESIRDAKGWISQRLPRGRSYEPPLDQAPMSARLDPVLARARSRSFRRLCDALGELLQAADAGAAVVTPR